MSARDCGLPVRRDAFEVGMNGHGSAVPLPGIVTATGFENPAFMMGRSNPPNSNQGECVVARAPRDDNQVVGATRRVALFDRWCLWNAINLVGAGSPRPYAFNWLGTSMGVGADLCVRPGMWVAREKRCVWDEDERARHAVPLPISSSMTSFWLISSSWSKTSSPSISS